MRVCGTRRLDSLRRPVLSGSRRRACLIDRRGGPVHERTFGKRKRSPRRLEKIYPRRDLFLRVGSRSLAELERAITRVVSGLPRREPECPLNPYAVRAPQEPLAYRWISPTERYPTKNRWRQGRATS